METKLPSIPLNEAIIVKANTVIYRLSSLAFHWDRTDKQYHETFSGLTLSHEEMMEFIEIIKASNLRKATPICFWCEGWEEGEEPYICTVLI